ncbi:hypothetical protein JOF42_002483 [Microbacterium phyllosphaerae]|uniref:Flagellar hook-length control protein-like C-terminal domain-containing protein n=1 Tax=Microbacterium phyllosphaerae TaxID=124798 RepID=A0ABS4WRZ1_9MICO|nr:hypothetical protein [Microbacterium phyllosphaerae]MBP2378988.1 hypothetical protein [Microbacterium phyllosphaerae]
MTAVSLIGVMLGAQTDADSARTEGGSGALFGDALIAAGQMLDDAENASSSSSDLAGESGRDPRDAPAGEFGTPVEVDAATTAMLQLAAQLVPGIRAAIPPSADGAAPESSSEGESTSTAALTSVEPLIVATTPTAASAPTTASAPAASDPSPSSRMLTPDESTASVAPSAPVGDVVAAVAVATTSAGTVAPASAPGTSASASVSGAPSVRSEVAGQPATATVSALPSIPVAVVGEAGAGAVPRDQVTRVDSGERAPSASPATSAPPVAVPSSSVAPAAPVSTPETAAANRAVAAQVSPVVVSIAQRPTGTHHLTMTVNPDSLGPVTVRAHISASGEVQVELSGATDAGRDALRGILIDLRRDLATVMPHATLSINQGTASDANSARSGQEGAGGTGGDQAAGDRDSDRGRSPQRTGAERAPEVARPIPTTSHAGVGAGLDIFA